jgi:hypothetical protein
MVVAVEVVPVASAGERGCNSELCYGARGPGVLVQEGPMGGPGRPGAREGPVSPEHPREPAGSGRAPEGF